MNRRKDGFMFLPHIIRPRHVKGLDVGKPPAGWPVSGFNYSDIVFLKNILYTRMWALSSDTHFRSPDQVILRFFVDFHKVSGKACDPDHQVFVFFRRFLCLA